MGVMKRNRERIQGHRLLRRLKEEIGNIMIGVFNEH